MKYKIYHKNRRFLVTDLYHPKLISEWCKNLNNTFIVTFDTPWNVWESYENGKRKEMPLAQNFWKGSSFGKNNSLISEIFSII